MAGEFGEFDQARVVTVKNTAGEEAPVGGVLEVTGIDATTGVVTVRKPAADSLPLAQLLFVHSAVIPAGGFGTATGDLPWRVKYETADGTPTIPDAWGSKSGSWELDKGKTGLVAWGGAAGGTAVFQAAVAPGATCDETPPVGWTEEQTCVLEFVETTCVDNDVVETTRRVFFPFTVTVYTEP